LADIPEPLAAVYTEVDERGNVVREIGLDRSGKVVYRKPSTDLGLGRDGLFYLIDLPSSAAEIDEQTFNDLWRIG
jgi:hypothetical protein